MLVLLPDDPDASAKRIRDRIRELTGREVAVLITDSFGRPWRQGTIDVALGASGLEVMRDLRGTRDGVGYELHSTMIAVALPRIVDDFSAPYIRGSEIDYVDSLYGSGFSITPSAEMLARMRYLVVVGSMLR